MQLCSYWFNQTATTNIFSKIWRSYFVLTTWGWLYKTRSHEFIFQDIHLKFSECCFSKTALSENMNNPKCHFPSISLVFAVPVTYSLLKKYDFISSILMLTARTLCMFVFYSKHVRSCIYTDSYKQKTNMIGEQGFKQTNTSVHLFHPTPESRLLACLCSWQHLMLIINTDK